MYHEYTGENAHVFNEYSPILRDPDLTQIIVSWFYQLQYPVALVQTDLLLIEWNPEAFKLISRANCVVVQEGKLTLCDEAQQEKLSSLLQDETMHALFPVWTKGNVDLVIDIRSVHLSSSPAYSLVFRSLAIEHDEALASLTEKFNLTKAEQRVLSSMIESGGTRAIADRICSSVNTVKSHIKNLYRKIGVRSRTELIRIIKEHRW